MEYMVGDYDALNIDGRRMSLLTIEGTDCSDADVELSDYEKGPGPGPEPEPEDDDDDDDDDDEIDKDAPVGAAVSMLPGTAERRRAGTSQLIWAKGKGKGKGRERWLELERAWELRKCREAVVEQPLSMRRRRRMDMDEVKACRDLGLGLPGDWTVEIPTCAVSANYSHGGDDPEDVKARLRSWAQAVALASATRLTC